MATALMTILTSSPLVRSHSSVAGRIFQVETRTLCDPQRCPFKTHQHWVEVSKEVLPLKESAWVEEWQYLQRPLPGLETQEEIEMTPWAELGRPELEEDGWDLYREMADEMRRGK